MGQERTQSVFACPTECLDEPPRPKLHPDLVLVPVPVPVHALVLGLELELGCGSELELEKVQVDSLPFFQESQVTGPLPPA